MQAKRMVMTAFMRVSRPKAAGVRIQISGAVVVLAQMGIPLLPGKQIVIWRRANGGDQGAEGIIRVSVGNRAVAPGEQADAAMGVVAVEVELAVGIAGGGHALREQVMAVGVNAPLARN